MAKMQTGSIDIQSLIDAYNDGRAKTWTSKGGRTYVNVVKFTNDDGSEVVRLAKLSDGTDPKITICTFKEFEQR